jgi:hypothetical protein
LDGLIPEFGAILTRREINERQARKGKALGFLGWPGPAFQIVVRDSGENEMDSDRGRHG